MSAPLPMRIRTAYGHIRWAFGLARSTCPRLFVLFGANAAVMTLFPAGIALSVRGLVNSVNDALGGLPLEETAAFAWLVTGFLLTLGTVSGSALNRYFAERFEIELRHRLNLDLMEKHSAMPLATVEDQGYRNSLGRAQQNPEATVSGLYAQSLELATKLVQVASLMLILVVIEPLLFVLLVPIGIPYLLFQWRLSQRQFDALDRRIEKERWTGYLKGTLTSAEQAAELRLFQLQPVLLIRLRRILDEFRELLLEHQRFELIGRLVFAVLSVIAVYIALTKAAFSIVEGQLTIGDLAIFGSAAAQLRFLIEQAVSLSGSLRWKLLGITRIREYVGLSPGPVRAPGAVVPRLRGEIEFRNVRFTYPGASAPTLHGLSFHVEAGETVALVGENGAGKTTVAKLIARLYDADAGSILYDGTDMGEFDTEGLRRQVSCVFQHFGRYSATVLDNIAFGDWERLSGNHERVREIARSVGIDKLIQRMPEGYDTLLGRELGRYQPSGGQWQQLAIARAMARDAPIVILDEPTANLDVRAEDELFRRFLELAQGRTKILISHRFSTVSRADRILVMESGGIVESGTHDQLIREGGRYARMYELAARRLAIA